MKLSENLKKIRKEHHLSQEQFAEKLGVSRQSVSKWESEVAYPELDKIVQISKVFNVRIDDLLNENIQEISSESKSRVAINRILDSFLSYITKSIDLFSSMKIRTKLKCILEQIVIISILFCFFMILGATCGYIVDGFISAVPNSIYRVLKQALESLYILFSCILGTTLVLHIFKIRYLDYYEIVRQKVGDEEEKETEENIEKSFMKRDDAKKRKHFILEKRPEKIIIRNPEGQDYKFIKGLLKIVLFFIKMMVLMFAFGVCLLFIGLVACLITTFLITKTGLFFIGLFLFLFASIVITLIFLQMMIHFVINRRSNKKFLLYSFFTSLIVLGIGIGFTLIGLTKFQYIGHLEDSSYYTTTTVNLDMKEDLMIYDWVPIQYIEEDRDDIKIECLHSSFSKIRVKEADSKVFISTTYEEDPFAIIRTQIKDINRFQIVDYSNFQVTVYASRTTLDTLQKNKDEFLRSQDAHEEEIREYEKEIRRLEDEVDRLQDENSWLKDSESY